MLPSLQAPTCPRMSADYIHSPYKLTHAHTYTHIVAYIISTSETSVCKCHYVGGEGARSGLSDVMIVKEGLKKVGL